MGFSSLICCAIALAGCGQKSPESQLQPDVESTLSWTASLRFASQAWLHGKVSTPYYRSLLKTAEPQIRDSAEHLKALSVATPKQKQAVDQANRVTHYIAQLKQSPQFPAQKAVAEFARRLEPEEAGLRKLENELEAAA